MWILCYYIKLYQRILILYCPCPICALKEILRRCPPSMLVTLYKLPSLDLVDDFLQKVATVRGELKKGGVVDVEAAARIVLHDWNQGMC